VVAIVVGALDRRLGDVGLIAARDEMRDPSHLVPDAPTVDLGEAGRVMATSAGGVVMLVSDGAPTVTGAGVLGLGRDGLPAVVLLADISIG
jgi:hypothetical protein